MSPAKKTSAAKKASADKKPLAPQKVPLSQRRKARQLVLQALYQWQLAEADVKEIESQFREETSDKVDWDFFQEVFFAIPKQTEELQQQFEPLLDRDISALDPIEKALLYLGTYELAHRVDVPYRVVINECIELAKMFGATESHKYINGILDKLAASLRAPEIAAYRKNPERNRSMSASEFEIIQRYFVDSGIGFSRSGVELGIGDDGALLRIPEDKTLTMSMDVLQETVHFPSRADASLIANRALAVNLSDMAAMAAQPMCFTMGLVLPESTELWLQSFSSGLLPLAREFNCPLVGGDTSRGSGQLTISIQVHGLCDADRASLRSGAKANDRIYVSGKLGDGAIALLSLGLDSHLGKSFALRSRELPETCRQYFSDAYYRPRPRIELAQAIAHLINSNIDVSDGLLGDLGHICRASKVGANVFQSQLPFSESAKCCVEEDNLLKAALFGGDDYEICFTVAEKHCDEVERIAAAMGEEISCIGEIVEGEKLRCLDHDGKEQIFDGHAYRHF